MRLVLYEIKKLFGRRFIAFAFAALLLAVGAVAYLKSNPFDDTEKTVSMISAVEKLYKEDPDALRARYDELAALSEKYEEERKEQYKQGNYDYHTPALPSTIYPGSNDLSVLNKFYNELEYFEHKYSEAMSGLARSAKRQVDYFESLGQTDTFMYRYNDNLRMICNYNAQFNMEFQNPYGWDKLFNFSEVNVFILAFLLLVAPVVALGDDSVGAASVISTTKKGRAHTSLAKLASLIIIAAGTVILFSVAALIGIWAKNGLSSPGTMIQAFRTFTYCPWFMTVLEAFLMALTVRITVFCGVTVLFAFLASATGSYRFSLLLSAAFAGGNYAMHTLISAEGHSFFKWCNIFTATDAYSYFYRYNVIKSGNALLEQSVAVYAVYFAFVAVFGAAFCVWRGVSRKPVSVSRLLKRIPRIPAIRLRTTLGYEFKKSLVFSKMLLVLAAAALLQIFVADAQTKDWETKYDYAYRNYCTYLQGELTPEKEEYVASERQRLTAIRMMQEQMAEDYASGKITLKEYTDYLDQYYALDILEPALKKIEEQLAYIKTQVANGNDAHFVYETGMERIIETPVDYVLLAVAILAMCGIWAEEYTSGMDRIMRCSKNGRRKVFRAKLAYALIFTAAAFLIFEIIRMNYVFGRTHLTDLASPALSMQKYSAFPQWISFKGLFALFAAARLLGAALTAVSVLLLSRALKRGVYAAATAFTVWLIPSLTGVPEYLCPLTLYFPAGAAYAPVRFAVFCAVLTAAVAACAVAYGIKDK
ncbi:MAG: hypothetical protein J5760_02025 [Clostridia bacterium]|nr:hypothetical protein [Clostridia bacterium]